MGTSQLNFHQHRCATAAVRYVDQSHIAKVHPSETKRGRHARCDKRKIVLMVGFDLDKLYSSYEAFMPGIHLPPRSWPDIQSDFSVV